MKDNFNLYTKEEDAIILDMIAKHKRLTKGKVFKMIAQKLNRTPGGCCTHYHNVLKLKSNLTNTIKSKSINRNMWSSEEDTIFQSCMLGPGSIKDNANLAASKLHRTSDACEARWYAYLKKYKKSKPELTGTIADLFIGKPEYADTVVITFKKVKKDSIVAIVDGKLVIIEN